MENIKKGKNKEGLICFSRVLVTYLKSKHILGCKNNSFFLFFFLQVNIAPTIQVIVAGRR